MNNTAEDILNTYNLQKQAYVAYPMPSVKYRIDNLKNLKNSIISYQEKLVAAMSYDFGHRSSAESVIADILPTINSINYHIKNIPSWVKPEKRKTGLLLAPAKINVHYQPLGVIGIIVPWNFPVQMSMAPLIAALSSGNRVMIKMSEYTPSTNAVITEMINGLFQNDEVAIIQGGVDIAEAFSKTAFDHLIFTGSSEIGKKVMKAASANLTPVTLELGGKSPVIICDDIDIRTAVERLILGKCINAGQICVAPDYVFCPKGKTEQFITEFKNQFKRMYNGINNNDDYSNIINDTQFQRLIELIDDAKEKGGNVVSVSGENPDNKNRRIAPHLVTNVNDDMQVMQNEIFGPVLPIIPYDDLQDTLNYINRRPRPLALYVMTFNKNTQNMIIENTHSGGVCINDTAFHVAADDAPFGGIGSSGMGQYHGKEGFLTFSKAKTVMTRGRFNSGKVMFPPYGQKIQNFILNLFIK